MPEQPIDPSVNLPPDAELGAPVAADAEKGLPMTAKWDPERLAREEAALREINAQPFFQRIRGYAKLTGPAWLQSAMTLGAGSAVASVVAGAAYGYQLLWVQPVAMFLGIMMLAALGNVVLSSGERPYSSFAREISPLLAFLWALGTVLASVIWHFPQYTLAAGVTWDTANALGVPAESRVGEYLVRFGIGFTILGINIFTTWNYGSRTAGIKLYEGFIRWVIRLVIISFLLVFVINTFQGNIDWGEIFRGYVAFQIPRIEDGSYDPHAVMVILGALGASVGINMTFLYGYSMLAKGWGKYHKGLSRYDLFSSMFLPFVIVTSLVIIAMASTVHGTGVVEDPTRMAPLDASRALRGLFDFEFLPQWLAENGGRIVFNLGFLGMVCGAISTHMVVCGFTFCEMFKLEYSVWRYRLFTLVPAIGMLGVVLPMPMWGPIVASAVAFTMLPIAYLCFIVMNNKRSYLGDAVGKGWTRWLFNAVLVVALTMSVIGASILIYTRVITPIYAVLVGS